MKTETIIPEELTTEPNNLWDSFQTSYQANWTPSQRTKPLQLQIQSLWFFFLQFFVAGSFLQNILIPQVSSVLTGCDGLVVIVLKIKQVIVQMFHMTTFNSQRCWTKYIWNTMELVLVKTVFNNSTQIYRKPVIQLR